MKTLLSSLTNGQKIMIAVAVLIVAGSITGFVRWNKERDFKPLYSGISGEDAGPVLTRLKESGVEYRVADGGAILVPSAKVAELRLQMAAAGLPKSGRIGFELFDKSNFGVTDFAEQVNYHRALEGELERSVMSLSEVEAARVHITFPKNSIFTEEKQEGKASVVVKLRAGAHLSPQNVAAITQMVASAVEGLKPEGIALVDMQGNLLSRPRKTLGEDGSDAPDAALDYKQRIEKDMLAKINSTLEPLLGPEKFKAGVSVECDFSAGEQSEEIYDPSKSVMATSQKTEDISGGTTVGGVPGSASNLPRPTSRPTQGGTGVTRRTENITFQTSRTVKRLRIPQGNVRRVSAAILVDHNLRWERAGKEMKKVIEPPAPEKLKAIHDIVAGIIGLQAERGDQVTVEALPFETTMNVEPAPVVEPPKKQEDSRNALPQLWMQPKMMIGVGAGVLLVLILGVALLRRGRSTSKKAVEVTRELPPPESTADKNDEVRKQLEGKLAEQQALKERQELEALAALKAPQVTTQKAEVLTKHLAAQSQKDPAAIANTIRSWLNEK